MGDNHGKRFLAAYALIIILSAAIYLTGCTQQGADNGNGAPNFQNGGGGRNAQNGPGNGAGPGFRNGSGFGGPRNGNFTGPEGRNGSFGNLTEEQRQQLVQQREQAAISACEGGNEGDACEEQNPRGNTAGTCKTQNGNLMCVVQFQGGRRPSPTPQ